ncbi:hypothetical protein CA606_18220 [Caulobacter vibrioides]|uniref:Bacteriophage tail tape measure N-terminal domain-containing protein n=1 Tax=Caulobacter vibrioides TaxID=155892 RepID=A0A290N0A2_CAUVI|nr:phage tail length tape measure family protein [Caulobacter vibrioides]ATC34110.2 hypothetical protein CA606_18220 [Caulobacter vibrioides]
MTTRQISYRLKADGKAELQRDARDVGDALQNAGDRGAEAFGRTARSLQNNGELTDRQITKYKALANAAREAERAEEAQRRVNEALGVGRGTGFKASDFMTGDELGGKALTRGQRAGRLNLARQGADVFTTGMMGMDPALIAIQQGPQILDAMAQAGIKATPAVIALGAAVTATGAAVIALGAAGAQYENQQVKVNASVAGFGAALQISAAQLDGYARAGADAGDVSVTSATNMAMAYIDTGKVGGQVLGDLIGLTKRYALTTKQDIDAATQDLAKHFSTGSKGAEELNDRLHFLNAAELEHIKNLYDSGRETEAQQRMIDGLNRRLVDATTATSGWDYVLQGLGRTAEDVWRKVGRAIAVAMGGGTDQEKLKQLLDQRNMARIKGWSTQEIDQEIGTVRGRISAQVAEQARVAANVRDTDRAAISARYRDPKVQALQDKQNELTKYLGLGGDRGDTTAKAIQADIDALKKGYGSAADMATKLEAAHNKALREGSRADRKRESDARKAEREAEEAIRLDGMRADHAVDNLRRIAQARGDESTLDYLERQGRLQDEINRYLREGFNLTQATANARAQITAEMSAEAEARAKGLSNPDGFVSADARIAAALKDANIKPFSAMDEYIERFRLSTRSAFEDGLMSGIMSGNFWDAFRDRLKYAAADALARSFATNLFGSDEPGGKPGKLVALASKLLPKFAFATGTDYAPGGLSLVGEYGPEIVDLPRGAGVRTAAATQSMLQSLAGRAANASPGEVVNFHYSPTYRLQGTAEEIRAIRVEIDRDRKAFKENAVAAYIDAKNRRRV